MDSPRSPSQKLRTSRKICRIGIRSRPPGMVRYGRRIFHSLGLHRCRKHFGSGFANSTKGLVDREVVCHARAAWDCRCERTTWPASRMCIPGNAEELRTFTTKLGTPFFQVCLTTTQAGRYSKKPRAAKRRFPEAAAIPSPALLVHSRIFAKLGGTGSKPRPPQSGDTSTTCWPQGLSKDCVPTFGHTDDRQVGGGQSSRARGKRAGSVQQGRGGFAA